MLRIRVLTAVVLLPIVVGLTHVGGVPFLALVMLLLSLAEIEFCHLMARGNFHPTLAFGLGMVWLLLLDAQYPAPGLLQPGLALLLLASLAWQLFHRQGSPVADWALTIAGGLYLGLCGASLIRLRGLPDGFWWTLTVLFTIMTADSGAYFVGRAWGRHKLTPTLSPGKTWEGTVGGFLVTVVLFTAAWFVTGLSAGERALLGALIAVSGALGDLAESRIKRQFEVKDSGGLIPGHGGVLDRFDSLLFVAPAVYAFLQVLGWLG